VRQLILLIIVMTVCSGTSCKAAQYGVARSATPVLNTPSFSAIFGGRDGKTLKTDRCGQVREMEFIALPGTSFKLLRETSSHNSRIYQVETPDYPTPVNGALYVDSRFIELRDSQPPARARELPGQQQIISELRGAIGSPYVWGGNLQQGVGQLSELFYYGTTEEIGKHELLAGLDCSGLLYQATDGWTPRNTSQLISFGTSLAIAHKTAGELTRLLEPLDLIVWNGHVIIVLDKGTAIESRLECGKPGHGGVVTTELRQRLAEIMRTRRPMDSCPKEGKQRDLFVVRRWFGL